MTTRKRMKALMGECWEDATEIASHDVTTFAGEYMTPAILAAALFRARWTLETGDE